MLYSCNNMAIVVDVKGLMWPK